MEGVGEDLVFLIVPVGKEASNEEDKRYSSHAPNHDSCDASSSQA